MSTSGFKWLVEFDHTAAHHAIPLCYVSSALICVEALFCTAIHACSDGLQQSQLCLLQLQHFLTMQYIEKNSVLCFHLQRFQSVIIADNSLDCQSGRVSGKPVQPHNTGPGGLTGSLLILLGTVLLQTRVR